MSNPFSKSRSIMRSLILLTFFVASLASCQDDSTKSSNKVETDTTVVDPHLIKTIQLPKNEIFVTATWSGVTDIWYVTRKIDEKVAPAFPPQTYYLRHANGEHYYILQETR